jgi:membrane associated rhomboid family serine protease
MFVLPLGLGTRLRRWPIVTIAVGAIWMAVAVIDHSDQKISDALWSTVARTGVRDHARRAFVDYCVSRKGKKTTCERYAVLIWTGYPGIVDTQRNKVSKLPGPNHPRWRPNMEREARAARSVRKELRDCDKSRRCYAYKDMLWRFMDNQKMTASHTLSQLTSYKTYLAAVRDYRVGLGKICRENNCLVGSNVNGWSLGLSQLRHGGMLHLFSNMLMLTIFGIYVEQRTSRLLYLGVLAVGGTLGMLAHAALFSQGDRIVLGGSANVSAVLGMFYVFFFHQRMKFLVWLPRKFYWGTHFMAPIKYCFPLLFVLTDVVGGLDSGFSALGSANVAHFAHLTGFLFGAAAAGLIVAVRKLPKRVLYETELADMTRMAGARDMRGVLDGAERILHCNPDNVHAMEYACGVFLRWSQVARVNEDAAVFDRARQFVAEHLQTVCAVAARDGEERNACKLLSQVPLYMPYRIYLGRLGQLSTLKLADFALQERHPILALRLYDFFLIRYPLAVQVPAIEATCVEILSRVMADGEHVKVLTSYLNYHPESLLAPRIGAWLANARAA